MSKPNEKRDSNPHWVALVRCSTPSAVVDTLFSFMSHSCLVNEKGSAMRIFAIFYFLLIMPQQRRQKKWQQMLNDLKTGDKVVTSGGLRGTVIALRDDYIQLRVPPDNLRIEVTRASVASVMAPEDKNNKAA